jgi:CRP-like cAMP-binding protein
MDTGEHAMAVTSLKSTTQPTSPPSEDAPQRSPAPEAEWWIKPIGWVALAVFLVLPILSSVYEDYAGGVVWTMMIASLPVFIVLVGYHRWRRICPVAFLAQLPARFQRPGTRKAGPWLEANYYYVTFSVFFMSLWLRLIATNGDGHAISAFFVLLSLSALLFGVLYTGKTWCNYICPLSFIEKIYTEPRGLCETPNSQCVKCTACKKSCPDINEENGYWKEIDSRPKRAVYYAFPGLVCGFYCYFYLQAGTWHYYFSGAWTRQRDLVFTAFLPGYNPWTAGLFFLPAVPRALAAAATLAVFSLASLLLFSQLQRLVGAWLRRRETQHDDARVSHLTMSIAAFTAFITFYSFAGAPTLRLVPWLHQLFGILVVAAATLFLARRLLRTPQAFAEETLARNILKHWEWTDVKPPQDLREAFLIHTVRAQESQKGATHILDMYKKAVRVALADGFVTREEVQQLEALRHQLDITPADHEKIMSELAEEERDVLSDLAGQVSAEKRLQLETYARALETYLERLFLTDGAQDDSLDRQLRARYAVTEEEHAAALDELFGGAAAMTSRLSAELRAVERVGHTIQALEGEPSLAQVFLIDLLQHRRTRAFDRLVHGLSFAPDDATSRMVRAGLAANDRMRRQAAVEQLSATVAPSNAERLLGAYQTTAEQEAMLTTPTDVLRARTWSVDPYMRAAALYLLGEHGGADDATLARLGSDEHRVVREVASCLQDRLREGMPEADRGRPVTTLDKMLVLRTAPLFCHLAPEELAHLARRSVETTYPSGSTLFREGSLGDEVLILLEGEVTLLQGDKADEQVVGVEVEGGLIADTAVLAPAPRSVTARAGANGTRVLRLHGYAFREALHANPIMTSEVIRLLAPRLHSSRIGSENPPCTPSAPCRAEAATDSNQGLSL